MKELKELDVAKHTAWRNLVRIAGETMAPIKQLLLKKVGLAIHDLRLRVENVSFPLQIRSTLWNDSSLLNDRYWRVPLQPYNICIHCVSKTNPVISAVALFGEIPEHYNDFVFLDNPSSNHGCWSVDLSQPAIRNELCMPVLTPGRVVSLEFQNTIWLGPREDKIEAILDMAHQEKDAVMGALFELTRVGNLGSPISASSSSRLAFHLKTLSRRMMNLTTSLAVRVAVVMDDDSVLPFVWNNEATRFDPMFYSGGLTPV